jgi:hypothetical protein
LAPRADRPPVAAAIAAGDYHRGLYRLRWDSFVSNVPTGSVPTIPLLEPLPIAVIPPLRERADKTDGKRLPAPPEKAYKWSQLWYDDRSAGTIVFGHEHVIHLGNGEWQPLDDPRTPT